MEDTAQARSIHGIDPYVGKYLILILRNLRRRRKLVNYFCLEYVKEAPSFVSVIIRVIFNFHGKGV